MFEDIFRRKKLNTEKLEEFGFVNRDDWTYNSDIMDGEFSLTVRIDKNGHVDTDLMEIGTGDSYILYKTNASGTFVGEVRTAIETVLREISETCYESAVFKTKQAQMLIEYVHDTYGDELEFLWQKFPDNAIWRRKDNRKWYAAILTVQRSKLGMRSDEIAEIIDLRIQPENMEAVLRNEHYYPGWHMNKRGWYTTVLDEGVPDDEICRRLDESYRLAKK